MVLFVPGFVLNQTNLMLCTAERLLGTRQSSAKISTREKYVQINVGCFAYLIGQFLFSL